MLQGIDISQWQNTSAVDLAKDFVIIKATEGVGFVDPTCDTKYQYAKSKGKLLGVYHFARPDLTGATAEADYFVNNTTGYWQKKEAVLVLDWESGNTKDVSWALAWCQRVENRTGIKPIIYMSASVIRSADWGGLVRGNYGLWVAGYPNKYNVTNPPVPAAGEMPYDISPWGFAAIWQYTSSAGTLDRDVAYMTREAWGLYAGKKKEAPKPAPVVTTKDETAVTDVDFKVVTVDDDTLNKGKQQVVQTGVLGRRTVVTRVTYTDGKETKREVISDKTVAPVDEIVHIGTHDPKTEPTLPNAPEEDSPISENNGETGQEPVSDVTKENWLRSLLTRFVKSPIFKALVQYIRDFWNMK